MTAPYLCCALIVLCSGCSLLRTSSLTESAPLNIPSHTGRNQVTAQAGYGGKRGFDGSISYAISNHIAVGGSVFSNQQTFNNTLLPGYTDTFAIAADATHWESQVSYYRCIRHIFTWAATGGYGDGTRGLRWRDNHLESRYNRYFVQMSGNAITRSGKQVGIGVKLHYTDYALIRLRQPSDPVALTVTDVRAMLGVDLAQTIRLPLSPVLSATGQFGYYLPLSNLNLLNSRGAVTETYGNAGLIATVGLVVSLPGKRGGSRRETAPFR